MKVLSWGLFASSSMLLEHTTLLSRASRLLHRSAVSPDFHARSDSHAFYLTYWVFWLLFGSYRFLHIDVFGYILYKALCLADSLPYVFYSPRAAKVQDPHVAPSLPLCATPAFGLSAQVPLPFSRSTLFFRVTTLEGVSYLLMLDPRPSASNLSSLSVVR